MVDKEWGLTEERAQQVATSVAGKHGNLQCDACASEIARTIGRHVAADFVRVATADGSDVLGLAVEDLQIATTGYHVGVRIGKRVFDNHFPDGVPEAEWPKRFITLSGAPLEVDVRPIADFFGKGMAEPHRTEDAMTTVIDLVERIREHPGVILGWPSARTLYAFLSGFAYARKDGDSGDYEFLAGFRDFVRKRYGITSSQGWAQIIQFFSVSEPEDETFLETLGRIPGDSRPRGKGPRPPAKR